LAGLLKPVPSPAPLHVIVAAWPVMRLANRKRKDDMKNFIMVFKVNLPKTD
jgi:hypothetical protein